MNINRRLGLLNTSSMTGGKKVRNAVNTNRTLGLLNTSSMTGGKR